MPSLSTLLLLGLLPLLLIGSAFFSGGETAFFSLTRAQRLKMTRRASASGRALGTLMGTRAGPDAGEQRSLLVTLLLGNMTINVTFFVITSVLLIRGEAAGLPAWLLVVLSLVPLVVMILLGEVLPKLVAARLAERWSSAVAVPMLLVHRAISPVRIAATAGVIAPLARLIAPSPQADTLSVEEIDQLVSTSGEQAVLADGEALLLRQAIELSRLRVRDLMVPRVDVAAYDLEEPVSELLDLVTRRRLRHVPVHRGGLDHIEGMVYAREVLLARGGLDPAAAGTAAEGGIGKLVRQTHFVPEQQRADRMLVEMRKTGRTFSIVVDEFGGTAGLITLEDLAEHLFGDIPGSYEPRGLSRVTEVRGREGVYEVDANLMLIDWPDRLDLPEPESELARESDVATLGGLVMTELDRLPAVGDGLVAGPIRLEVKAMEGHRITRIEVQRADGAARSAAGATEAAARPEEHA
ncbi:hemolysin family protein [Phycisphaera mikurensis]|uniref:CNNM transmembrane domain-containing protein n=1 Tax=Phycisphaera mikurensis (strain NBRC 102666 / KCTC 22515 / FYK2301M01) TaxID=1142394 RepID=I0II08_PHYMF|nr:hemolysin family protein [Phycisphaera mikurensis]MBB6442540.1 putative hemolysin [Phycisphaera mikurensis]BAM04896.1 hypothetical protein PSMK_27370 [Phycisphaera mikurensis NBRC 102666]